MSRFRITRPSQGDLRDIRAYIAEHGSTRAAARWVGTLRERFQRLADTPGMGQPRDDLARGLRSLAVGEYLIFYIEVRAGIDIVHVLHGARDIERLFREEQSRWANPAPYRPSGSLTGSLLRQFVPPLP